MDDPLRARRVVSREAAIGIVIERTGWDHERAGAWLAAQVALGRINPELHRPWPPYRLIEIEDALSALVTRAPPAPALPTRRASRAAVRDWLAARYAAGSNPNERTEWAAAKQEFPGITRTVVREERRALLDPEQLKTGRRG